MPVSSSTEHWIRPDALKINLNHFGDPDYLQVSLLAGAVVMAFKQDVISYNAAHNYRNWPLQAANTYLETSSAYHVYARLTRSEVNASALVVYDTALRDINGREISTDSNGQEVLGTPSDEYFYVFLGTISSSLNQNGESVLRGWDIDLRFGTLATDQYQMEDGQGEWTKMFRLNKVTDMIDVLKNVSSAIFKKIFIGEKPISDIKRSSDEHLYPSDEIIPTTAETEKRYLNKNKDDRSSGVISSDKGFEAGEFVSGATGAAVYKDNQGAWHIETDNIHVRRKFSANEVEIQTTNYIGGQTILSAASMKIDRVEEYADRFRCLFRKKNSEGDVIKQEWKLGDCAYCNTFNLEEQADGTIGNHFYWMEVVGVSTKDWNEDFHYVELSKVICVSDSSAPKIGDKVVHLGYNKDDDAERQNATVIAGAGSGSPYIQLFVGIKDFILPEPEQLKPGDNRLSGVLSIKQGSTGASNLKDLPDFIDKAVQIGSVNLLLNSGFTGNYESESMEGTMLSDGSELFSKTLKHWDGIASVKNDSESVSGKSVEIGSISQAVETIKNEYYVISFKAKGSEIAVSCGGYHGVESLTNTYKRYEFKFQSDGSRGFLLSGTAKVCDLQLERGTIATDWNASPYDNDKTLAEFQALKYIQDAIVNGSTDVIGGLILTSMIKLGNYKDGILQNVNAGVSGIYNDADDVAFWAGGQLEDAIRTVVKFKSNPMYRPTDEEWSKLANFAVSHGGDVFLRGYVYALGGYFRGAVEIANGKIMLNDDGSGSLASEGIKWDANGLMYRKATDVIVWTRPDKSELDYKKGSYFDLSTQMYGSYSTIILPNPPSDGYRICISLKKYIGTDSHRLSGMFYIYDEKEERYVSSYILSIYRWSQGEFWLTYHEDKGWYLEASEYTITDESTILGRKLTYVIGDNVDSRTEISEDKFKTKKVEVTDASDDSIKTNGGMKVATKVLVGGDTETDTLIERSMVKSDTMEARTEMKSPKMSVSGTGADSISTNGGVSAKEISLTGSMGRSLFLASPSEGSGSPTFRTIAESDIDGYDALKTKVGNAESNISGHDTEIQSLKNKVVALTTANNSLTEKVTKLETDFTALTERVVELEKKHSDTTE